jgi:hypothetical protein
VLPEGGRTEANIDGDIENGAADDANELSLCAGRTLEMQAANDPGLAGAGMVVLHEHRRSRRRVEGILAERLREEAPRIAVAPGREQDEVRNSQSLVVHVDARFRRFSSRPGRNSWGRGLERNPRRAI